MPEENSEPEIISAELLKMIVCPVTRGPLVLDKENSELISEKARLAYPIRDGIPILLEGDARNLDDIKVPIPPEQP